MIPWTSEELDKIEMAEELQIAPLQLNGKLRRAVTIWVVRVGDNLYVRSYHGCNGSWFRAAQVRHEGHIQSGGVDRDVIFVEEIDSGINDQIDAAYRAKYRRYPQYVSPMVTPDARETTTKLVPRS